MARLARELRQLELRFSSLGGEKGSSTFCLSDHPGERDFEYAMIDGTIVRVHQQGTGARGGGGLIVRRSDGRAPV